MAKPVERTAPEIATAPIVHCETPDGAGSGHPRVPLITSPLVAAILLLLPVPYPHPGTPAASVGTPLQVVQAAGRPTSKLDSEDDDGAGFRWSPSKPATATLPRLHGLKGLLAKPASAGDYQTEHIEHFWQIYHGRNTAEKTKPLEHER